MEVHPLQNSLILKNIFSFGPITRYSVKNQRLVCKAWKEASEPQWKLLAPLTILQDPQHGILEQGTTSMCQLVQDTQMNQAAGATLVHKNFTLRGWTIDVDHYDTLSNEGAAGLTQLFWSLYGNNISTLTLSQCTIPYNFIFLPIVLWRAVPNLEELTLTNCKMEIKNYDEFLRQATGEQEVEEISAKIIQETDIITGLWERMGQLGEAQNHAMLLSQVQEHEANLQRLNSKLAEVLHTAAVSGWGREKSREDPEAEIIEKKLLKDFEALSVNPVKLRRVQVKNLQFGWKCKFGIRWSSIANTFPNLEHIFVRHLSDGKYFGVGASGYVYPVQRQLKEIDVMFTSSYAEYSMPDSHVLLIPTEKLSFDCGFNTYAEHFTRRVLWRQADCLKELVLFRAPVGTPYCHFMDGIVMSNLTKFHLWGNVSRDLTFLKFTPNLKTLQWNTTCYDQDTHGARLHDLLGEKAHVWSAENIVTSTTGLDVDFKLESLETLEMVSGALSLGSVKKLGKWFPNVTAFKAVVVGDAEMIQIGAQWRNLKSLELGHGSRGLADAILHVYRDLKGFQKLKNFTWQPCSCERRIFGVTEMYAVHELRKTAGNNVVHAWKRKQEMLNDLNEPYREDCLEALFEKALEGGENVDIFKRAISSSL